MDVSTWKRLYANSTAKEKPNKFHNVFTEYNGRKYHSKKEANYAYDLDLLKKQGVIRDWKPQITFPLIVNNIKVCNYIVDFVITNKDGSLSYIEIKGSEKMMTAVSKLKYKLFQAIHPEIDFKIVF